MQWIVDGSIHLTSICTAARWKWKDCVTALVAAGLTPEDAQLYAGFAFGMDPMYQRNIADESLEPGEYARLSIAASGDGMHPAPPNL